jgi:phosphoadenosine phosphosulfate reductase
MMLDLELQRTAVRTIARHLEGAGPYEIIDEAIHATRPGKLAVVSSFGTESAALLALIADVDKSIPVLFLNTGWLFQETLRYRDELTAFLGLTDVRSVTPSAEALTMNDPDKDLWFSDPNACCGIRKVQPLERALADFDGSMNGRKRYQSHERSSIDAIEQDGERLKFNPFAFIGKDDIQAIFAARNLPQHPLSSQGFKSLGCMACTTRTAPGEDTRAGRWRGQEKRECGIHRYNNSQ